MSEYIFYITHHVKQSGFLHVQAASWEEAEREARRIYNHQPDKDGYLDEFPQMDEVGIVPGSVVFERDAGPDEEGEGNG